MDDMQTKLEQYRLRKRRKEKFEEIKGKLRTFLMLGTGSAMEEQIRRANHIVDDDSDTDRTKLLIREDRASSADEDVLPFTDDEQVDQTSVLPASSISAELAKENKLFKFLIRTVYFLFWCTLFIIAIELKFGIVFLMFSALFGIYFNTRTGPKKRYEISAYSVFNKNCESIDGTLKAEQFEREMRFGAGSVR